MQNTLRLMRNTSHFLGKYTVLPKPLPYRDRLSDDLKRYRELLSEKEQTLYDIFLPYVLSFTSFQIDLDDLLAYTEEEWTRAMRFFAADYPETAYYMKYGKTALRYDPRTGEVKERAFGVTYFFGEPSAFGVARFHAPEMRHQIRTAEDALCGIAQKAQKRCTQKNPYPILAKALADEVNNGFSVPLTFEKIYQWLCQQAGLPCLCHREFREGSTQNIVLYSDGEFYFFDARTGQFGERWKIDTKQS